jgi:hypothetical protein
VQQKDELSFHFLLSGAIVVGNSQVRVHRQPRPLNGSDILPSAKAGEVRVPTTQFNISVLIDIRSCSCLALFNFLYFLYDVAYHVKASLIQGEERSAVCFLCWMEDDSF